MMGKHKRSRTRSPERSQSQASNAQGSRKKRRKSDQDVGSSTSVKNDLSTDEQDRNSSSDDKSNPKHMKDMKKSSESRYFDTKIWEGETHHSTSARKYSAHDRSYDTPRDHADKHVSHRYESQHRSEHLGNNLRLFQLQDPSQALVILDHPESLIVKGKFKITCVCGSVSILGHKLSSGEETYPVYSPETHSFISVQTINAHIGDVLKSSQLCSLVENETQWESASHNLLSCQNPVVVLIQKLDDVSVDFASSIPPFNFLFRDERKHKKNISAIAELKSVGVKFYGLDNDVSSMRTTEDGADVENWLASSLKKGDCPVVLICGGKNVGKSTLMRSLMNAALNIVEEIAYLECDVGQTEFTPPACVSVTKLTQPIFGPPFSHQIKPLSCCFTGSVTPGDDPGLYMKCLSFVHKKFLEEDRRCPVFVNTMGWTEGIGLALLTDTLRLVKPDLVVQFDTASAYKNLPDITPEFVATNSGWTTKETSSVQRKHTLKIIHSITQKMINHVYSPKEHRTLGLLAYLGQMFIKTPIYRDLQSLSPYEVPWHQVAVHVMHMYVPRSQIMYALNASVVALCIVDEDNILTSDIEGYPKFLKETPVCSCLGLGVIRSIDPVKKVFYLLTPVPLNELSKVNCITRGIVEVPQPILQDGRWSQAPYNGYLKEGIGSGSIAKRKHIVTPKSK